MKRISSAVLVVLFTAQVLAVELEPGVSGYFYEYTDDQIEPSASVEGRFYEEDIELVAPRLLTTDPTAQCSSYETQACWDFCGQQVANPYCTVASSVCTPNPPGVTCRCIYFCANPAGGGSKRWKPKDEMQPLPDGSVE
jgi:hypothetical protein